MAYHQLVLRDCDRETTGWVEWSHKLKAGVRITLRHEPETVWTVVRVSDLSVHKPPAIDWKVGGLV